MSIKERMLNPDGKHLFGTPKELCTHFTEAYAKLPEPHIDEIQDPHHREVYKEKYCVAHYSKLYIHAKLAHLRHVKLLVPPTARVAPDELTAGSQAH